MVFVAIYYTIGMVIAMAVLRGLSVVAPERYEELYDNRVKGVLVMNLWTLAWPLIVLSAVAIIFSGRKGQ